MNKVLIRYFTISLSLLLFTSLHLHATTYYIDYSSGNDYASGTSITAPWKSVHKVNNFIFHPGDSVLFKRGEIWKEYFDFPSSGNAFNPIVIGSYGEGEFPIITGIDDYEGWDNSSNWTSAGNNIWSREQSYNPQRMWINGNEVLRNEQVDSLDGRRYMWAWENSTLYVYSLTNPAVTFNSMEVIVFYNVVRIGDKKYITVQDIEFQGGYDFCLAIRGSSNITVKNCRIGSYSRQGIKICDNLGISSTYVIIDNCVLDSRFNFSYGEDKGIDDGIQITSGANDCIVKNSVVKDFGHAGVYLKALFSTDNGVFNNKIFRNLITGENVTYQRGMNTDGYENKCRDNEFYYNVIKNTTVVNQVNGNNNWVHHNIVDGIKNSIVKTFATGQGFALQGYGTDLVCHDNKIDNNLIMNCDEPGIAFNGNGSLKYNNYIRNNVIINCGRNSKAGYNDIGISIENDNSIGKNYFYNNCVFNGDENLPVIFLRGYYMPIDQFNGQTIFIDEAQNNIQEDPLIESSDSLSFYLTENSPCIDAGLDVGLSFDYYGNLIYFGNAPDIGIHEYSFPTSIFYEKSTVADNFILQQNYPNPFNPTTTIRYQLPRSGFVQLIVYNALGQEVIALVNEYKSKGNYLINFNAEILPSGVYLYSLRVNDFVQTHKMALVK
jgi:hypothetical protein